MPSGESTPEGWPLVRRIVSIARPMEILSASERGANLANEPVMWNGAGRNAGFHLALAALRIEEEQAIEKLHFVCGADAAIEIVEIGAAAERDVLAIIDVLAVGQHVGGCAAAEEGTLFEQPNAPTGFS